MTQLDTLDDEMFQNIQEYGSMIQTLVRESMLLEHRISLKQHQNNALTAAKNAKTNELTTSDGVLANLTAAQQINWKSILDMRRLRDQYEQHIAPHVFAQTQTVQNQQNSARSMIISQLQEDCKHYVDLYELAPEVKSLRMQEKALHSNETKSVELKAQIKCLNQKSNTINKNLMGLQQTFVISMINNAVKDSEINHKIEDVMQQTAIKRKVLSDCVLKIKADEEVQNQKYHEVNEIKNQKCSLVFSLPVVRDTNIDYDFQSQSPVEIPPSLVPENDDSAFVLDITMDQSLAEEYIEDEPQQAIDASATEGEIHRTLSSLTLSGQPKRVRFDPSKDENQPELEANEDIPSAQDVSHSKAAKLQGFTSGFTTFGYDGDSIEVNSFFNQSNLNQSSASFHFNNSKDNNLAELTEPNSDAEDYLSSNQNTAKPMSKKNNTNDQISFDGFDSQMNLFSTSNFNLDDDADQQPSLKRAKFDFSLSRTATEDQQFGFEAFDNTNADMTGNSSSVGFNFNGDNTDGQDASADFDFGDPNISLLTQMNKIDNLF